MLQVVSVLSIYTICLQIVFVSAIFLDSSCCCYEREQMTVVQASDWLTNQARVTQYKINACSISLFIVLYLPIRDKLSWTRCREMHSNSRSQLHLWWILWWPINFTSMFVTGGWRLEWQEAMQQTNTRWNCVPFPLPRVNVYCLDWFITIMYCCDGDV